MPSSMLKRMAMDMLNAIERTSPSQYKQFEDYMDDYQMRWEHAFSLLRYAEEVEDDETDEEDEEDEDYETDEESVIGKDEGDDDYESDGESVNSS